MHRKNIALLFILTVALIFVFSLDSFSAGKEWGKFDEGIARAKKENKVMLVDFYADWCHWCKVMDEKTFKNKDVAKKLAADFVTVRLNAEDANETATYKNKTYTNVELTRAFGVTGFPTIAFLDAKGEPITLIPGYVPPETFLQILNYIDQGCYKKNVSFEDYVKKGDCKGAKAKAKSN